MIYDINVKMKRGVQMSKIKDLLNDKDTILVFDIDGVLASMEWGEYNHFELYDAEWFKACEDGFNAYQENRVVKKIQEFLKKRDTSRVYVISKIGHPNEASFKKDFCEIYYDIPRDNVFLVWDEKEKADILMKIRNKYPELESFQIAMVEDTVKTLTDIMEKTGCATVHISSFIDLEV